MIHSIYQILAASLSGDCDERLCLLGLSLAECWLRLPDAAGDEHSRAKTVLPIVSLAVFHASPQVRSRASDAIRKLAFIPVGGVGGGSGKIDAGGGGDGGDVSEENIFDAQVITKLLYFIGYIRLSYPKIL